MINMDNILNFNQAHNVVVEDTLDDIIFSAIAKIESKDDIFCLPLIDYNQKQSEINDTSKENETINFIYNKPEIELICPFVGRKRIIKVLRFKKRRRNAKNIKKINFVD